jgi:hypothetical protein
MQGQPHLASSLPIHPGTDTPYCICAAALRKQEKLKLTAPRYREILGKPNPARVADCRNFMGYRCCFLLQETLMLSLFSWGRVCAHGFVILIIRSFSGCVGLATAHTYR